MYRMYKCRGRHGCRERQRLPSVQGRIYRVSWKMFTGFQFLDRKVDRLKVKGDTGKDPGTGDINRFPVIILCLGTDVFDFAKHAHAATAVFKAGQRLITQPCGIPRQRRTTNIRGGNTYPGTKIGLQ